MKNKRLILISCCAAAALIASPAFGEMHKKSTGTSASKQQRMAARTTQVTPRASHATRQMTPMYSRNSRAQFNGTRQYAATRYYGGSRYAGTRYYGNSGYYGNNGYYGGTGYYYGGGSGYPSYGYSYWPNSYSYWPYNSYSYYPYSYNNYGYSYYTPAYGYDGSMVAAVQRRLGEMGYYHGLVDGVMGPQTRDAIAAYESRHGLMVDGRISRPLLGRLGLG